ncbi:hypothetical protein A9P82_11415 [Arachidicoccus ginsenosidimutans]|uniref:right-handed parallel beta-helix repeat-containing protein n=1 Tax=Arachidicoccus sp. BS20 TaxID=1850526 RepID=UPI0007F08DD0|nr:right-handed parallel beta-helix repeat-containing protein [Arachidicoccus sp. BS20]ANI89841.1 hypothetical protein A9P82_11415 [Arachidicoccus sp. BS20]
MKRNIINYKLIISVLAVCAAFASCDKELETYIQPLQINQSQGITSDTLSGTVKGTLISGKTYYFKSDITINEGDTLYMEAGSKLISLGDGASAETSPQITCNGTFISIGTEDQPNFITVSDDLRKAENAGKGYWGGIQCGANSGDLILKWTHLEFAGGPAGINNDPEIFESGDPRNSFTYTNPTGNVIVEDSWFYGTKDDGFRIIHGNVSIMRNTFENCGTTGGDVVNIKNNSFGDVAYNLIIGGATNGFKISNSGGGTETNIFLYNNTILNSGFRQSKGGRGGSIDYEKGASGKIYNNIIINCRYGLRITPDADYANISHNNQFYYADAQSLIDQFADQDSYADDRVLGNKDIAGSAPNTNLPNFISYDVNQFDYSKYDVPATPLTASQMPLGIVTAEGYDFNLLPGSPALGKGDASGQPMKTVPQGGTLGASETAPSVDLGAYPSNGNGNKHLGSSLDAG